MSVYVLAQLRFKDKVRYQAYQQKFRQVFALGNGTLLAADEAPVVLEGEWARDKVVLMQFPSSEDAHEFLESDEYRLISEDRKAGADNVGLLFRGI